MGYFGVVDDNSGGVRKSLHLGGCELKFNVLDGTEAFGGNLAVVEYRLRPLPSGLKPNVVFQSQQRAQPRQVVSFIDVGGADFWKQLPPEGGGTPAPCQR